jgi:hypothetical protein
MNEQTTPNTEPQLSDYAIGSIRLIVEAIREVVDTGHEHHWEITGVQYPPQPFHPRLQGYLTQVLVRCDICNLPQVVELAGRWDEDKVRGIINASTDQTADPASAEGTDNSI